MKIGLEVRLSGVGGMVFRRQEKSWGKDQWSSKHSLIGDLPESTILGPSGYH